MPFASVTDPERFEGMLVKFTQALVISEYFNYDQFGEIVLALPLDGEPRPFTGTAIDAPGADANARTLANSLRRITLDDAKGGSSPSVLRHPNGNAFACWLTVSVVVTWSRMRLVSLATSSTCIALCSMDLPTTLQQIRARLRLRMSAGICVWLR